MRTWELIRKSTGEVLATITAQDYVESHDNDGTVHYLFIADNAAVLESLPHSMGYYEIRLARD